MNNQPTPLADPASREYPLEDPASREYWASAERYLTDALISSDPVLDAIRPENAEAGLPPKDVSTTQGKFLNLLVRIAGARNVLEIGTLGGYSAVWLARAVGPGGQVVTLELEPHFAEVARAHIDRAGVGERVQIRVGPALDSLVDLEAEGAGPFDLIFIDADKPHTEVYVRWAVRLAHRGTVVVVDNVVFHGMLIDPDNEDEQVPGVRRGIRQLAAEPLLDATALSTVGAKGWDGFAVALVTDDPPSPGAAPVTDGHAHAPLISTITRSTTVGSLLNPTSESRGYCALPRDICPAVQGAVEFSQRTRERYRDTATGDAIAFRSDLLTGDRYEDAPELFDLALSDALVQLACDYLDVIPLLGKPRLWWHKPGLVFTGSGAQAFHMGDPLHPQGVRQAKFLFAMDDIVDGAGPLTFFPADLSRQIADALDYRMGDRVADDVVFGLARDTEPQRFTGPAGSGLMLDTSRCFHYGRRTATHERLMLMIQFKAPADLLDMDRVPRSAGFEQKFGHDRVRSQMVV